MHLILPILLLLLISNTGYAQNDTPKVVRELNHFNKPFSHTKYILLNDSTFYMMAIGESDIWFGKGE